MKGLSLGFCRYWYYIMFEKSCQSYIFDNKKYILSENGELKEVLQDFSKSGKENNHANNKRMTNYLSEVYRNIQYLCKDNKLYGLPCDKFKMNKKSNKLVYCSTYLEFAHLKDETKHISYIESCHKSLCPTCNFFRARFNLSCFIQILSTFLERYSGYKFLFLTLTVRSCYGEDLPGVLDELSSSFEKFQKSKEFRRAFVAASRSLEITVNRDVESKSYMMFHPHYHIILVARPDYFVHHPDKRDDIYLSQLHFLWLWQRANKNHNFRSFDKWLEWYKNFWDNFGTSTARLLPEAPPDLITQVDVRTIKIHQSKDRAIQDILKSAVENIKYPFKPDDLLTGNIEEDTPVVFFMDRAMQHRRRWNLSGLFRDISKELSIPEEDPEELVQTAGLDPDEVEFFSSWWFFGKFGEYLRGRKKTDSEKNAVRRFLGLPQIGGD